MWRLNLPMAESQVHEPQKLRVLSFWWTGLVVVGVDAWKNSAEILRIWRLKGVARPHFLGSNDLTPGFGLGSPSWGRIIFCFPLVSACPVTSGGACGCGRHQCSQQFACLIALGFVPWCFRVKRLLVRVLFRHNPPAQFRSVERFQFLSAGVCR